MGMGNGSMNQYGSADINFTGLTCPSNQYGTQDYSYMGMGSRLNFGNIYSTQMAAPSIITNTSASPTQFFTVPTPIFTDPNPVGFVSLRGTERFEVEVKPPPPPQPYPFKLTDFYPAPYPYSY
jgi:hypothetical protein